MSDCCLQLFDAVLGKVSHGCFLCRTTPVPVVSDGCEHVTSVVHRPLELLHRALPARSSARGNTGTYTVPDSQLLKDCNKQHRISQSKTVPN